MVELSLISEFIPMRCIFVIDFFGSMADFSNRMCCQYHFLHPLFLYALDMFRDDVLYHLPSFKSLLLTCDIPLSDYIVIVYTFTFVFISNKNILNAIGINVKCNNSTW
jgi:hypothetical protein